MIVEWIKILSQFLFSHRDYKITASTLDVENSKKTLGQIVRHSYETVKAMREYRAMHGNRCRWCSTKKRVQIHHIVPIWQDPTMAANKANLFPLCRRCHLVLGHACSWKGRYVKNVVEIVESRRVECKSEDDQFNF